MVGVEQDPDLGRTGAREHRVGLGETVDEACHLALRRVHRLEADPGARLAGDGAEALQRVDEQIRCPPPSVCSPSGPARQATHSGS